MSAESDDRPSMSPVTGEPEEIPTSSSAIFKQAIRSSAVFLMVPADLASALKTSLDPRSSDSTYPELSGSSAAMTERAVASSG